jgi:ankyrin repeat protein
LEPGCIRSLSFPEQGQRLNEIHTAYDTCQWLSHDQRYKAWTEAPRGILWIKGNPGVGKSVIMKHAVRTSKRRGPDELLVSFFLHGQGSSLQRTPLGLFRALLNHLLPHYPSNLTKLTAIYKDRELRFGGYLADRWKWECNELQEALSTALVQENLNRHVTIFIDALDECGEGPARYLLEYFSNLNRRVESAGAHVKICLSSRHYPVLGLDMFPAISVEEENGDDIRWYVEERLRDFRPYLKGVRIVDEVLTKAQGAFQWVFLVTERMRTKILIGGKAETLLKDLAICPDSLNEMYAALVQGGTESEQHQMRKLFQWIMFAERHLSAQELREALATDSAKSYQSVKELRSQDCWSDTLDDFERYVKHVSKGLVQFHSRELWEQHEPGGEDWNREAQLIHQSVADFLLETPLQGTDQIEAGAAHLQISRSCLRYIGLKDLLAGCQLQRGALSSRFPLAPYATRHVFQHINAVEHARIDQSDLLPIIRRLATPDIARSVSKLWDLLNPHNIGTPVGWPFARSSDVHLLAGLGTTITLSAFLRDGNRVIDTKDLNGNNPLHIALASGHQHSAMILLDLCLEEGKIRNGTTARNVNAMDLIEPERARCIDLNVRNDDGETILDIAVAMQAHLVVTRLFDSKSDIHRMNQSMFLQYAITHNNMAILTKLIEENIGLSGAVYAAIGASASDEIIVELLKAGVGPEESDPEISENNTAGLSASSSREASSHDRRPDSHVGGNALHLACRRGLSTKVDLLLSHGVPATSLDAMLRCPLHVVSAEFYDYEYKDPGEASYDILASLLSHAPEVVEFRDISGDTPLTLAAEYEAWSVVFTLLASGRYENPSPALTSFFLHYIDDAELCDIISEAEYEILDQIEKLDLKQKNGKGQTIFWLAAAEGVKKLVKLLLDKCAVDINSRDDSMTSPLLAAVSNGYHDVVEILLQAKDVDVNAQDMEGTSPLLAAVKSGSDRIVQDLLAHESIDVHARDFNGDSPLSMALEMGQDSTITGLLAFEHTGDDLIDAVLSTTSQTYYTKFMTRLRGNGPVNNARATVLFLHAIRRGNSAVIELLLTTEGVNIPVEDIKLSSLFMAIRSRRTSLVSLLLAVGDFPFNGLDRDGNSALCVAVRSGDIHVFNILVHATSFDVNAIDRAGHSPLRLAAEQPDKSIFKILIADSKTNLDIQDSQGRSTLSWAAEVGNVTVVMTLLNTGRVNVNRLDSARLTPLDKADQNGHRMIATLLRAQKPALQQYVMRQLQPPPDQPDRW